MKNLFKVGDRVKIIGNTNSSCNRIGETGTITATSTNTVRVLGDKTKKYSSNWSLIDEIQLIIEEPQYEIY